MTLLTKSKEKDTDMLTTIKEEYKDIFTLVKKVPQQSLDVEQGIRILLNLAPVGGAIEKLIFGNKDKKEIEQIKEILWFLGIAYQKVNHEKLNKEFLHSDEFYVLFKRIFEKMKFESRTEKLMLYRNFLLSSSLKNSNFKIDKNYLLNKLDVLEVEHFRIMQYYLEKGYIRVGAVGSVADRRGMDLEKISPHFEIYETDLVNFGFFKLIQVDAGKNRYMLQPLGIDFLKFVNYSDNHQLADF